MEQQTHEREGRRELTELRIVGLSGRLNREIVLNGAEPTILTGANGTGKSTVLRSIEAVATASWKKLASLPVDELDLNFGPRFVLRIRRSGAGLEISRGSRSWIYNPEPTDAARRRYEVALRNEIVHNARNEIIHNTRTHVITAADARRLWAMEPGNVWWEYEQSSMPDWLENLVDRFSVHFVTDQRLVINDDEAPPGSSIRAERMSTQTAVDEAASFIRNEIDSALRQYATLTQQLDRDFPQRVTAAMKSGFVPDRRSLTKAMKEVAHQRAQLQRVGLEPGEAQDEGLDSMPIEVREIRPVILTVVEATLSKFAILESLRVRLQAFADFANQHYERSGKRLVLDQARGFHIELEGSDKELAPSELSSGEQQLLVLAYQVLFRAPARTLLLVDEPELSLHVVWQDGFLEDLARMGAIRGLKLLVATHSPALVGGRRDLRVSLD